MTTVFPALLAACPSVVLWGVAGTIAAIRWSRHPVVSALVVVAGIISVLTNVAAAVLPTLIVSRGIPAEDLTIAYGALHLVGMAGAICMVVAVFYGRQDGGSASVSRP